MRIRSYPERMTSRRLNLADLDLLVMVARAGSIGQAAATLGLTQPNVSRRIAALERRWGVALLHRSPRGSTLTQPGRVIVDWATALLRAADDFTKSVQTLREQASVAVRAAVSMTIAEHYAPAWLAVVRQQSPSTRVSLTIANSTDVAELVETGQVDLGFLESPSVRRGLRRRRVGEDSLLVAVAPGHAWSGRASISAEELSQAQLLVRESGSGTRETVERALRTHGLGLEAGLEMASNTALKSAAVAGMGPVVVSARALADELASGQLVAVPVRDLELNRPLSVVCRGDDPLSPAASALLRAVGQNGKV